MHQPDLLGTPPVGSVPRYSLFFALWPDDATRARIDAATAWLDAANGQGGRRLRPHRYHLTLRWLGEVPDEKGRELDAARTAAACIDVPAFDLPLDIAGGFASARVCWLGYSGDAAALHALRAALDEGLARSGVRFRRGQALVPHVTVVRDSRRPWRETPLDPPIPWRIDSFVLVRSDIRRHFAYTEAGRWRLRD